MTVSEAYKIMLNSNCADGEECERNYWKNYLKNHSAQKNDIIDLYQDLADEEEADLSNDEDDCFIRQALEYREIADWIKMNC